MTTVPPQVVQLACPNCRTPLRAQVFTLIDVSRQPELKNYLLSGQLNVVPCTNCGNVSMIAAPLIYHDPAKQLFLVHFPQQLNARPEDQERFIGDATSVLMRTLPGDMAKGYLLAPRRFLTMNSLIEAVLEADGISREMIDAQRQRVELIGRLVEAHEQGDEAFAALAEQHRADFDAEFFATLNAFAQASAQDPGAEGGQILLDVRDRLAELVGFEGFEDFEGEEVEVNMEELVAQLTGAPDEALEQVVADLRPYLDYGFFEALTAQIEQAERAGASTEAQHLTARRAQIVEISERLDNQARELFAAGAGVLNAVLQADDPVAALRERREQIDEAFLLVLDAQQAAAERSGNRALAERLEQVRSAAVAVAEEALSPEDRLINQLLQAETPQAATQLLRKNTPMINTALVKRLNELADRFEQEQRKEPGERLRQLAREAGAMLF